MRVVIEKPSNLENGIFETFISLVRTHSKLELSGLEERIFQAALLSMVMKDDKVLAIRAIKKPHKDYIRSRFIYAGLPDLHPKFEYETGWSVTLPDYRNRGLSQILLGELLRSVRSNVYSTTRVSNKPPQKILEKLGFTRSGNEFPGLEEPIILWLYYNK